MNEIKPKAPASVGFTIPKIDLKNIENERPLSHRDRIHSIDTSKNPNCFPVKMPFTPTSNN